MGGGNTEINNNMELHKDMPDDLISQFTTLNKTSRRS